MTSTTRMGSCGSDAYRINCKFFASFIGLKSKKNCQTFPSTKMTYKFLTTERHGQNLLASKFSFFLFFSKHCTMVSLTNSIIIYFSSFCLQGISENSHDCSPTHLPFIWKRLSLSFIQHLSIILHPITVSFLVFIVTADKEQAVKD